MSPDDARALRAGRATATIALLTVGSATLLVLLAAEGRTWAMKGLWFCLLAGLVVWSTAYFEMARHQSRSGLTEADREAWQQRLWPLRARGLAFLGGLFVPWFYLLGSPAQRRLASYERRPARRGRRP
jgi:hypothetical protein